MADVRFLLCRMVKLCPHGTTGLLRICYKGAEMPKQLCNSVRYSI
jgi:hypothetical protein